MNKRQATDYLQLSARTLSRYVEQGKIAVTYVRGKNGQEAQYNDEDIKQLKKELEQPTHRPKTAIDKADGQSLSIVEQSEIVAKNFGERFIEKIGNAAKEIIKAQSKNIPITELLTLTPTQAASLSGFSYDYIIRAIHAGALPHIMIGTTKYKIRRVDLDAWIKKQVKTK